MNLNQIKVSGRICFFLQKVSSISLETFQERLRSDFYSSINNFSFLFYTQFLKKRTYSNQYPMIEEVDILSHSFAKQYSERYKRLNSLSKDLYYYTISTVNEDIPNIIKYSQSENIDRVVVFYSNNILRDEKRLLKIIKLNSFLYYRESNFNLAQNLFNLNGFIRKKCLDSILKGKAKFSYSSTFRLIELEIDQEINSNLTTIRYIPKGNL